MDNTELKHILIAYKSTNIGLQQAHDEILRLLGVVGQSEQFYCAPYATGDKPNRCRQQCYECKTEPKQ